MAVSIADQFKILPTIPRRTGRQINRAGHPADNPSQVWQRSMYYPFMDYYTVDVRFDTCKTDFFVIVLSDIRILVTLLVSFGHCVVWSTDSDCPFSIICLLCCLIYRFWLPLWYLLVIVLSDIQILITLWFLLVIVLSDIQILIAPLVSFGHCVVWYTDSDCPFGICWSLCCLIYRFWFPLWYLLVIVFSDIQILISPLVSFGHCVVLYMQILIALWYLLVIVLSDIRIMITPLVSFGQCVV